MIVELSWNPRLSLVTKVRTEPGPSELRRAKSKDPHREMNAQLAHLCRGLSREFDAPDIDELTMDGYIEVDGVAIGMETDDVDAPERLTFLVDLGAVARERRLATLEEAMVINLASGDTDRGVIGLDRDTGHLVLVRCFDYEERLDVQSVAGVMRRLAQFSREFRESMAQLDPHGHLPLPDTHSVAV